MSDRPLEPIETLSRTCQWAVCECSDGCLRVRLDHVTLTFTPREFGELVQLLGDAFVRLQVRAVVAGVSRHCALT